MQHHARRASQDVGQNVMEDWLNLAGCLRRRKTASAVGFRSQASERVCGFVGISSRDEPRILLLPAATAAKLDLVYVHDHEASVLHVVSVAMRCELVHSNLTKSTFL
jgi:hypothetical protein